MASSGCPHAGWVAPEVRVSRRFCRRILFEVLAARWDPNFVFAFVPKRLAAKGAHLRYGYNHCEPGVWYGPDRQITEEDHLIWMSARDVSKALSREPQKLKNEAEVSPIRRALKSVNTRG